MARVDGLYALLIRNVAEYAIYMLDLDGRIISWNPGAERALGYSEGEIIGEKFSRFYTDEERAAGVPEQALEKAADDGSFTADGWRVRKDGSRYWPMVVIEPVHEDGEVVGFAKITRDMTEQRNARLAALESERRFRLLVQGVIDYAIYMLNPDGYVTNWNVGAERTYKFTAAEIIGEHFARVFTAEDLAVGAPGKALEIAGREGHYEAEGWRCRKDGSRFGPLS